MELTFWGQRLCLAAPVIHCSDGDETIRTPVGAAGRQAAVWAPSTPPTPSPRRGSDVTDIVCAASEGCEPTATCRLGVLRVFFISVFISLSATCWYYNFISDTDEVHRDMTKRQ